jgi:hypothetical protein
VGLDGAGADRGSRGRRDEQDFLTTEESEPIWPVRDPADEEALRALATTFGETLTSIEGRRGRSTPDGHLVLGLGEWTRAAAELHGHLTRRSVRVVDRIEEAGGVDGGLLIGPIDATAAERTAALYPLTTS